MDIKRVDLIQQLVDKHGYTKKAATSIVDDFTDIILYNLGNGDTDSIPATKCAWLSSCGKIAPKGG